MATEEYFDVDPDDLHKGGFDVVAPGYYVGQVVGVTDRDEDLVFDFRIVSASKGREAEVGKTHREWVAKNSKKGNQSKRQALLLALGIATAQQIKAAKEGGKGIAVDWEKAPLGRCCCLEIAAEEGDDGKVRNKVPYWNYYHPDSKDARRFPVDHKAIQAATVGFEHENLTVDLWETEGRGQQSPPPAAHAATDDFDPFA